MKAGLANLKVVLEAQLAVPFVLDRSLQNKREYHLFWEHYPCLRLEVAYIIGCHMFKSRYKKKKDPYFPARFKAMRKDYVPTFAASMATASM